MLLRRQTLRGEAAKSEFSVHDIRLLLIPTLKPVQRVRKWNGGFLAVSWRNFTQNKYGNAFENWFFWVFGGLEIFVGFCDKNKIKLV